MVLLFVAFACFFLDAFSVVLKRGPSLLLCDGVVTDVLTANLSGSGLGQISDRCVDVSWGA